MRDSPSCSFSDGGGYWHSFGPVANVGSTASYYGADAVAAAAGLSFLYEGQDIGQDSGSPIDFTYTPPFAFTGKPHRVSVELK